LLRLKALGIDDRTIELLLVKNPAYMLSGERVPNEYESTGS